MSDLTVANSDIENHGVGSSWAAPAGLIATAREALVKAVAHVPPAWLLPPRGGELFNTPEEAYSRPSRVCAWGWLRALSSTRSHADRRQSPLSPMRMNGPFLLGLRMTRAW